MIDNVAALDAVVRHAVDLDEDYDDIAPTITALESCGDTTLVPRLREALDEFLDEENFYGRDLIASILARIEGVAALPALLRASARDLGDDQDSLQAVIIDLLADRADSRPAVLECVADDSPALRRKGLWALGFVAEPADNELLIAAVTDTDPEIRSVAVGSLPDPVGDDGMFGALISALRDPVEQVRVSAASRLGYTGRGDAVTPLAALATDQSLRVRSMVAYALGRLGNADATPTLQRLIHDPDQHVREDAVRALGAVGGPAAVDTLLALAVEEDPRVRAQAARALANTVDSDPRAAPQLTTLARDPEAAVRAATISGLASTGRTPSPLARQYLIDLADDPDPMVRQRVAVLARHAAPDDASQLLRRYADDADQTVRKLAAVELGRLAGPG